VADYDYSGQGPYFVTMCTKDRACLFGEVADETMSLNAGGAIVQAAWEGLPLHYPHVVLDAFLVMPNHVHGIVWLAEDDETAAALRDDIGMDEVRAGFKPAPTLGGPGVVRAGLKPAPTVINRRHSLSEVVRGFKTFSSRGVNTLRGAAGHPVWQRNYFEHINRNDKSIETIRRYIDDNPACWSVDRDNPDATRPERKAIWRD